MPEIGMHAIGTAASGMVDGEVDGAGTTIGITVGAAEITVAGIAATGAAATTTMGFWGDLLLDLHSILLDWEAMATGAAFPAATTHSASGGTTDWAMA